MSATTHATVSTPNGMRTRCGARGRRAARGAQPTCLQCLATTTTTRTTPQESTVNDPIAAAVTKVCPGYAATLHEYAQAPHELPATAENFMRSKTSRDGLERDCKVCVKAYQLDWRKRKAGEAPLARAQEPATGDPAEPAVPLEAGGHPVPEPELPTAQYADDLALAVGRGHVAGYELEQVGALLYALPADPAVLGTPGGQAALEAVNEARRDERRRRDRDRKRAERAAAKAAAVAQA